MSNKNKEVMYCKPFYDCNTPIEVEGYILKELSEDVYRYEKIRDKIRITRVEVIGKAQREFTKMLREGYYEISIQDNGRTIKLFEKKIKISTKGTI